MPPSRSFTLPAAVRSVAAMNRFTIVGNDLIKPKRQKSKKLLRFEEILVECFSTVFQDHGMKNSAKMIENLNKKLDYLTTL